MLLVEAFGPEVGIAIWRLDQDGEPRGTLAALELWAANRARLAERKRETAGKYFGPLGYEEEDPDDDGDLSLPQKHSYKSTGHRPLPPLLVARRQRALDDNGLSTTAVLDAGGDRRQR